MFKVGSELYYYMAELHSQFIPSQLTVYSAPDDGRKGRPKHVEQTCSC